jgi:hypothetical protein
MTFCATTKIEYVRENPAVDFPVFPLPGCVEYDEVSDTVSMPLGYWQKIAGYKIDVDAVRDYFSSSGRRGLKRRRKIDRLYIRPGYGYAGQQQAGVSERLFRYSAS